MSDHKSYALIEKALRPYIPLMLKAKETILSADVSKYPIFVAHQQELELGVPIIENNDLAESWALHVSTLEEFVQRQIINMEKVDTFRQVYRQSKGQMCIFIIADIGAKFVFIPVQSSEETHDA